MTARPGTTLPELILVAWLFGLVLAALAGLVSGQGRLLAVTQDRSRARELVRATGVVLGAELRYLAASDLSALAPDSFRLRAVRGGGAVCEATADAVLVRYGGVRRPEPDKDSVLVVPERGSAGRAYGIRSVAADSRCGGALRLDLTEALDGGRGWALVFETGAYQVGREAVRYRRGAGGRQPLTEAVLSDAALRPAGPYGLGILLRFDRDSLPRLLQPDAALRVHLANWTP